MNKINKLQRKYNFPKLIDKDKISVEERATLQRYIRNVLAPANHENEFIANIENLKMLAKVSDLKYSVQVKDANDSGGDADSVGKTFDTMNLDNKTKLALSLLDKIAEKVPSDWMKDMQAMSGAIAKYNQAPR